MYLSMLFFPLFSFIMVLSFGSTLGSKGSALLSCSCMALNSMLSILLLWDMTFHKSVIYLNLWEWMSFELFNSELSLFMDSLSANMVLMVCVVSFLVHVYSTSYMKEDPHLPSFMGYLSLFTLFMLMLVTSQNYLQLFMGWEGVGLSSYLLINFWFDSIQANKAAIKAMLMNSMGDAALMASVALMWMQCGSMNFSSMFPNNSFVCNIAIPLLMLMGAVGKSAQMGLHTWLPDAMEGPTPVSALIHAATMVTAGVYLMISSSSMFENFPSSLMIVTLVGGMTALFAATMGTAQNDIKKMMAYSTCSQLGFMVLACGISYYSLSLFHLMNHAFFKALLFLSAGSVIHALSDEQDVSKMGGMIKSLPLSFTMMCVGSLALMGTPFLSGYYSKDLMLEFSTKEYYVMMGSWLALFATLLTAFYSFKIIHSAFMSFKNFPKSYSKYLSEGEINLLWPLIMLSMGSLFTGYLFKELLLGPIIHPIVPTNMKLLPFWISICGAMTALCLSAIFKICWNTKFLLSWNTIYSFLNSAWGFDKIMNYFMVKKWLSFGYNMSYKLFDSGMLEMMGPLGMSSSIMSMTQKISLIQSGHLFNYTVMILLSMALFLMLNLTLWFWGSKHALNFLMHASHKANSWVNQ